MSTDHPGRRTVIAAGAAAALAATSARAATAPEPLTFTSFDGARLAYRTLGEGRPTLLLHGLIVNGQSNWFDTAIAPGLAARGRQVVAPDFRGHGKSAAPVDPKAYPPDVLALDQEALLRHLGWTGFDLVGYSLGARMALRMLVRGARARRTVLGGLGESGVVDVDAGRRTFLDYVTNGPASANPQVGAVVWRMMAQAGDSRAAIVNVLNQQVSTPPAALAALRRKVLVLAGDADDDNGDPAALARLIPGAEVARVKGTHLTALQDPAFLQVMATFLDRP